MQAFARSTVDQASMSVALMLGAVATAYGLGLAVAASVVGPINPTTGLVTDAGAFDNKGSSNDASAPN